MKIISYYSHCPQLDLVEEHRLQHVWASKWSALGFEPIVLNEWWARKHDQFDDLYRKLAALPSINPILYDLACYLRHLAYSMAPVPKGELFLATDYDVIGYDAKVFQHYGTKSTKAKPFNKIVFYEKSIPSCMLGHRDLFEQQAKRLADYTPEPDDLHNGVPHTSDMYIMEKFAQREPDSFVRLELVKAYNQEGWETAPAVHFCNAACGPAGKTPRSKHIPLLRV